MASLPEGSGERPEAAAKHHALQEAPGFGGWGWSWKALLAGLAPGRGASWGTEMPRVLDETAVLGRHPAPFSTEASWTVPWSLGVFGGLGGGGCTHCLKPVQLVKKAQPIPTPVLTFKNNNLIEREFTYRSTHPLRGRSAVACGWLGCVCLLHHLPASPWREGTAGLAFAG